MNRSPPQLRVALLLGAAGALATLALFPYALALQPGALEKLAIAPSLVIGSQSLANGVLSFLLAWAGL